MGTPDLGRTLLELGPYVLDGALVLCAALILLPLVGILLRERRFVVGARVGFYALFLMVLAASACLWAGFFTGQYDNEYVYNYSERSLAWPFKIAGLWAGLDGSILFWCLILSGFCAAVALQHHRSARHPVGRRLEPWVYTVLGAVLFFFLLVTARVTNPFEWLDPQIRMHHASRLGIPMDPQGRLLDGHGLNPQLENYWMAIHPPSLYLGFVGFTVPFAFALASLLSREMGDYWIKVTRRWTMVAWLFLTNGIILGGLWAYEMLGWGGYWAWDPVENASVLPWLTGTAFLHSVMIQERRDMLKAWNVFLIILTFFMTIVATYMTRSGVVSSVHAFSEGKVGPWFLWFMGIAAGVSLFLLFFRLPDLRGKHQLESFLSREAAFYFNNLILVALAGAVYFLSMFPKISHDFLAQTLNVREPHYNRVTTPLFMLLVFLTAVGPQIGWVKASAENLQRNFIWPVAAGAGATAGAIGTWLLLGKIPEMRQLLYPYFYPAALTLGLAVFVLGTVYTEFYRGIRSRVQFRKERVLEALVNLFVLNNRRYGGYVVHVGFAVIVIGVVVSSFFRLKEEKMMITPEKPGRIGDYAVAVAPFNPATDESAIGPGQPYHKEVARFTITHVPSGEVVARLNPERHYYPKQDTPVISTPAISRNLINDYYIHYNHRGPEGVQLTVFVNPLVNWIWFGWLCMIAGGILAALPMPVRRVGLAG